MGVLTCMGLLALSAPRAPRAKRERSAGRQVVIAKREPLPFAEEIAAARADVRDIYPVPEALVRAVIQQESAYRPGAVSAVGARGLMQLMPRTARELGVSPEALFQPGPNILAGTRLLAVLLRHYRGDLVSVLVAYNSGPKRQGRIPSNGETPAYVYDVIALYEALSQGGR